MPETTLRAPISPTAVHLCVDMQNIFAPGGPWATPWMERVAPIVVALSERFAERTVFSRFITPERPDDMPGTWQRYYRKWRETTRTRIDPAFLELLPDLKRLIPPATVINKTRYSAFAGSGLSDHLARMGAAYSDYDWIGNRRLRLGHRLERGGPRFTCHCRHRCNLQFVR